MSHVDHSGERDAETQTGTGVSLNEPNVPALRFGGQDDVCNLVCNSEERSGIAGRPATGSTGPNAMKKATSKLY
jgi:hypothetical protein